jgi:hypothetical protein
MADRRERQGTVANGISVRQQACDHFLPVS